MSVQPTPYQCKTLEILHYPGINVPQLFEGVVDDGTLEEWFCKVPSIVDAGTQVERKATGGLRIVTATRNVNFSDGAIRVLTPEAEWFAIVQKHMCFYDHDLLPYALHKECATACRYSTTGYRDDSLLGFMFSFNGFPSVLNYNPDSKLTYAFLCYFEGWDMLGSLKRAYTAPIQFCSYPLLLCVCIVEFLTRDLREYSMQLGNQMWDFQEKMGQHNYSEEPTGNPFDLDFMATTRGLNGTGLRYLSTVVRLSGLMSGLEEMVAWGNDLKKAARPVGPTIECPGLTAESETIQRERMIEEKVRYLRMMHRGLLVEFNFNEKQVQSLIQVVYQFMAQKDTKINIALAKSSAELAKATKADSSAMKTIAVLGMLFLPGTFVATIFSMPVFDWDNGGHPVMKPGFRYYWVLTIPLTLVVLLSWSTAVLLPWRTWLAKPATLSRLRGPKGSHEWDIELMERRR